MNFNLGSCQLQVNLDQSTHVFTINGRCSIGNHTVRWLAAAPPDLRQSYSGSALPFPSDTIAYSNSQSGTLQTDMTGGFTINVKYPNSYYVNGGSQLQEPHVHLVIDEHEHLDLPLGPPLVPNRSLKNRPCCPNRSAGSGRATTGGWLGNR